MNRTTSYRLAEIICGKRQEFDDDTTVSLYHEVMAKILVTRVRACTPIRGDVNATCETIEQLDQNYPVVHGWISYLESHCDTKRLMHYVSLATAG